MELWKINSKVNNLVFNVSNSHYDFSEDMNAAIRVVYEMERRGYIFKLISTGLKYEYRCSFFQNEEPVYTGTHTNAATVICLAAIRALE